MIEIKEVTTKKQIKTFAKFPIILYKDCPYYIPSLRSDEINTFNPKKNFSLGKNKIKGFLAYKDGKLVGRIAGLINYKDNDLRQKKMIRFSRFECIDDKEVFKALLGAVEKFGKDEGMDIIHGPWGFNDQDREGMLTYGFDLRSTYATNYYFPYYSQYMKELGFSDESKWVEMHLIIPDKPIEKLDNLAKRIAEKYHFVDVARTLTVKQTVKKYGDKMFDLLNESYGDLDGYVPVEGAVKQNILDQFATISNMRYVSFIVDENDDLVAFGIVLPSICEALKKHNGKLFPFGFIDVLRSIKKPKELEMALIGVSAKHKNSGANAIIISNIVDNMIEDKIVRIETNPMLESNLSIQHQWKIFENEIVKKRQTYTKEIGSLIK